MRRRRGKGSLVFVAVLIALAAVTTVVFYVKKSYDATLERIHEQMAALPDFNESEVKRTLAKKLHMRTPVRPPGKTEEEIEKLAKLKAGKLADAAFSHKRLAKEINAVLRKYRRAKRGDRVKFYLKTTGKFIEGEFQRIIFERNDKFVVVDLDKYFYNDISPDYYYLFDDELAREAAATKVKEAKRDFKRRRRKFYEASLKKLKTELLVKNGYFRKNGNWTSDYEILNNALAVAKADFKRSIRRKRMKIVQRNKLFGLIELTPAASDRRDPASYEGSKDGSLLDKVPKNNTTKKGEKR